MFRGEKEEVLDLDHGAGGARPSGAGPTAYEAHDRPHGSAIADRGRPGDRWLLDTVRWAWRTRILVHLGIDLRMRLRQAAEDEAVGCSPPTCATCCSPRRPAPAPRWASTRASAPA